MGEPECRLYFFFLVTGLRSAIACSWVWIPCGHGFLLEKSINKSSLQRPEFLPERAAVKIVPHEWHLIFCFTGRSVRLWQDCVRPGLDQETVVREWQLCYCWKGESVFSLHMSLVFVALNYIAVLMARYPCDGLQASSSIGGEDV